jgi:acyl-CoA synthetase (AMP-forming)/AMP-acid ligase II
MAGVTRNVDAPAERVCVTTSPERSPEAAGPWMQAALAELDGMRTAVRTFTQEWSGRELLDRAGAAARFLARVDESGRPIPALVGSSPGSYALALGGAMSGHPIAPLGVRLAVPELVVLLKGLGASMLIADRPNEAPAAEAAQLAGVTSVVFDDFARVEPEFVPTAPETVVLVLHTSGTTGRPKTVLVRDDAVFHRSRAYQREFGLSQGDLYCSTGGFHHTGGVGMWFVAAACGAGIVPVPRFSVHAWRATGALAPTCGLLVPTMIDQLLEERCLDAVPLRALQYGTSPIHPQSLRKALEVLRGTTFTQAYGQTEGGPLTMLRHEDHLRALRGEPDLLASVGRPPEGVELRLDEVGEDGVGEVVARAKQVFRASSDGWLHTGDLGRLDDDGYLFLRGRMGDTIIRGGENVYPLEVERVLEEHPAVREAGVVGVESRRWGQTIKAVVVPARQEHPPDFSVLEEFARSRLAGFKVPAEWEMTSELPRNAAGKLLRRRLGGEP